MALTFAKKSAGKASATPEEVKAAASVGTKTASAPKPGGLSFLKTGSAAAEAVAEAEAKAELAKQEQGKLWRFFMGEGEDRTITFLDGDLDADGLLASPVWWEHMLQFNGNWEQFACTAEQDQSQPCPICESGNKPYLATALTIIDHTPHKVKSGPNAGKIIKNTRKLFVAKRTTAAQMTKHAVKRNGLAGCTYDVSRVGDKSANIGSEFEFSEKADSLASLAQKYGLELADVQPANYEEEIRYRSPEELIELGVAKALAKTGGGGYSGSKSSLKDEL